MLTQCHPDWRHSRKGRGGGPPPALSFCPMLLPSVYPAPPVVTLVKSPLLPQFSPAIQTDSSNTLKKKCAKLRLQGLPTADPSLGTSAPQECLLGWSQPAQGPGEKDPKQLHHSEITRAGRGANDQGRALRLPSPLLGFQRGRGDNDRRHHFSLSAFATDSPGDSGPTRCCSMRSSPANPDAPDTSHQAPIGCRHRSASPHSSSRAPKVVPWARRTETAISGKGPKARSVIAV